MKTELYKMFVSFCSKPCCAFQRNASEKMPYLWKTGTGKKVKKNFLKDAEDPESKAWNAFIVTKLSPEDIVHFMFINWKTFKDSFPVTCVFLDINGITDEDLLDNDRIEASNWRFALRNALAQDLEQRKRVFTSK